MLAAILAALQAIPTLLTEIQNLQKFFASESFNNLMQKIQNDTNALQQGPTTSAEKDADAKALASDTAAL